jgi:hypothetical protein
MILGSFAFHRESASNVRTDRSLGPQLEILQQLGSGLRRQEKGKEVVDQDQGRQESDEEKVIEEELEAAL